MFLPRLWALGQVLCKRALARWALWQASVCGMSVCAGGLNVAAPRAVSYGRQKRQKNREKVDADSDHEHYR